MSVLHQSLDFFLVNLQWMELLILLCTWQWLMSKQIPLQILKVSEYLSSVQRLTPSVRAVSSSLAVFPSLSVRWFPWKTTLISAAQAPDLYLFTRMALLSPGLSCLPFSKLPYNQQVSLERFQAIVKLELQLLTISLRLWVIGLAKLTCYMYVIQWKPSFLSKDDLCNRYELLYPSFELLFWVQSDLGISL